MQPQDYPIAASMQNNNSTVLANTSSTRRLLPAVAPQTFHRGPPLNTGPLLPRRKAHSTAACETCRKRKVKCNAGRPACGYCVSASIKCVYTTVSANETHSQALKRKLSELNGRETTYRQVFEHLRSRPESEAAEIVKRIQGGAEPESILRYIREGDLLLQLTLTPETRYRYVFPLVQEMPEFLVRPDNPYLNSWVYEWMATGAPGSRHLALSSQPRGVEMQSTHCKPYHAAELVDPLLNNVKPSEWTTVCSDDNLMRKMLANYFLGEYHWFPAFQKDYFLQDMAAGRHSYCSSLLVNVVLVLGSMATNELPERYEYWNPRNYGYQFLAEAKRLWEIETMTSRVRLTTIQASMLLYLTNVMNAIDAVGSTYTELAVDMAHRIKLFGPNDTKPGTKRRNARVFTAWALFNWQSMLSYAHFSTPLLKSPPASALPDPSADPEWYGQIWVRYPLDPKLYTTNFPLQFKAQSDSRDLLNEASLDKERAGNGEAGAALPAINRLYSRMKEWHDNLPEPLTPARVSLPSQLMLHINYHNIIINLYEPMCGTEQEDHPISDSQTNGSHIPTPVEIRDASARHFETLLRLYYLRHGYDHGDTYVGKCLVQLAFMTLKRMGSLSIPNGTTTPPCPSTGPTLAQTLRTLRSTLLLTAQGLHAQGASYFLPKAILCTLRAKMPPAEQLLLGQVIGDTGEHVDPGVVAQMRQVRSRVLPSAISFVDDPEVHRLGHLVKELGLGGGKEEGE